MGGNLWYTLCVRARSKKLMSPLRRPYNLLSRFWTAVCNSEFIEGSPRPLREAFWFIQYQAAPRAYPSLYRDLGSMINRVLLLAMDNKVMAGELVARAQTSILFLSYGPLLKECRRIVHAWINKHSVHAFYPAQEAGSFKLLEALLDNPAGFSEHIRT